MTGPAPEKVRPSRAERRARPPRGRLNLALAARFVAAADRLAADPETAAQAPDVPEGLRQQVRGHERAQARRVVRRKAARQARKRNR